MARRAVRPCASPGCNRTAADRYCADCQRERTQVVAVVGPPGSGKTAYVLEHAQRGDLIVDVDLLFMALSGLEMYEKPYALLPFVLAAQAAVIAQIGQHALERAWIISTRMTQRDIAVFRRDFGADVWVMKTPAEECKRRILQDERRPMSERMDGCRRVDEWFSSDLAGADGR